MILFTAPVLHSTGALQPVAGDYMVSQDLRSGWSVIGFIVGSLEIGQQMAGKQDDRFARFWDRWQFGTSRDQR